MTQGICRWCFEPIWKDDISKRVGLYIYHHNCGCEVEQWQLKYDKDWAEYITVK